MPYQDPRPHDPNCGLCDMAEFAGITYDTAHRRQPCPQCDGTGESGVGVDLRKCPRCGGGGSVPA